MTSPGDQSNALKNRLITVHTESEASKIKTLLQGLELGDQRPSQLLTRMRSLAGDSVSEPLLMPLWLSRLPATTQSVLAILNENLSTLATVTDKIHDLAGNNHNGINVVSSTPLNPIEQQLFSACPTSEWILLTTPSPLFSAFPKQPDWQIT